MKNKLAIFILVIICAAPLAAMGPEHWEIYSSTKYWTKAFAVVEYQDWIYVSGRDAQGGKIWRTQDGTDFFVATMTTPVKRFIKDGNVLYGINEINDTLETSNGLNWRSWKYWWTRTPCCQNGGVQPCIPCNGGQNLTKEDYAFYDGKLYAAEVVNNNGYKIYVTTADVVNKKWGTNPVFKANLNGMGEPSLSFSVFDDAIFWGVTPPRGQNPFPTAHRWKPDETSTTSVKLMNSADVKFQPGSVLYDQKLYWAGNPIMEMEGDPPGSTTYYQMERTRMWSGQYFVPFMMFGELHAYGIDSNVMVKSGLEWVTTFPSSEVSGSTLCPSYHEAAALGNMTFILPDKLMVCRKGFLHFEIKSNPLIYLNYGDKNAAVLRFKVVVNGEDTMTRLQVIDQGTAKPNVDIIAVRLARTGDQYPTPKEVARLSYDPKAGIWSTSSNTNVILTNEDELSITVDVAKEPTAGATCQFAIPAGGVSWKENADYTLPIALVAPSTLTIRADTPLPDPPVSPIENVVVFPTPAKGKVNFLYTLNSPSDVNITIYDRSGKGVSEIEDPNKPTATRSQTLWDAAHVAPGIYFAVIKITAQDGGVRTIKTKVVLEK